MLVMVVVVVVMTVMMGVVVVVVRVMVVRHCQWETSASEWTKELSRQTNKQTNESASMRERMSDSSGYLRQHAMSAIHSSATQLLRMQLCSNNHQSTRMKRMHLTSRDRTWLLVARIGKWTSLCSLEQ